MSKRAILAATAILVGSFNPVLTTAAWAALTFPNGIPPATGPTQDTKDLMQDQCDAFADGHGGEAAGWHSELDESSIGAGVYVSGPTEVGTHSIDDALPGTLEGAGTFTPGSVSILGDPYRNGGSVNMFGVLQATGGHYSASEYDFMGDFDTVYSYAFNCNTSQTVATGHHLWDNDPGAEDFHQQACDAIDATGNFIGIDVGQCIWAPTGTEEQNAHVDTGVPVEETQTENLLAHEDAGEGFDITETVLIGQAVICISPSKTGPKGVPGTWTKQNGYTGDKCTTAWFDVAPWGHGSQDSNGTYISVPLI
jgi:hypothetical protein